MSTPYKDTGDTSVGDNEAWAGVEVNELRSLSEEALKRRRGALLRTLWEAHGRYWEGECEAMVREVKTAWGDARYLFLDAAMLDEDGALPYWSLDAVVDASGGAIASHEIDTEAFEAFRDSFMSVYGSEYADWFTVDERPYFDLETRRPLTRDEYARNINQKGV